MLTAVKQKSLAGETRNIDCLRAANREAATDIAIATCETQ